MAKPEEKTILVVDDEEDVRDFLSMVLDDAGFKVITACDGNEAMEMVQRSAPDFISLDLVMPGKSGIKFLHELRRNKEWARIPVVIVTAHAHDELGKDDFEGIFAGKSLTGPQMALEKPVNPETYVRLVCEKLGVDYEFDADSASEEHLRGEVNELLRDADREKLAEIMKLMREKEEE